MARAQIAALEQEVRNLRKMLRDQNWVVLKLDEEGGRRFDLVDKDLSQLREDILDEINHKIQPYSESQEELEKKILLLEMQVGKLTLEWETVKEEQQATQVSGETNKSMN